MSDAFYTELLGDVVELIDEFGRDVTFQDRSGTPIDPTQPWRGQTLASPVTLKAAIFQATANDHRAFPDVTFSSRALIAGDALITPPDTGDQIRDSDNEYGIARRIDIGPGNIVVAHVLLLTTER